MVGQVYECFETQNVSYQLRELRIAVTWLKYNAKYLLRSR
jgi:hypothetical protein